MDGKLQDKFILNWNKYFPGADLPIVFYYTAFADPKLLPRPAADHRCLIGDLARVRKGKTQYFNINTIGCNGGKRYCGFTDKLAPDFEYFLSCGIPGKLEGERYKKSPEIVKKFIQHQKPVKAPGDYIVFKRWDNLTEADNPAVVIFFAPPDVLSGLFTLANFAETDPHGVISPFCAGCASIVDYPHREFNSGTNRAVLGLFDVSARPFVPAGILTLAVLWPKFILMVDNMNESFFITKSWSKVKRRIKRETTDLREIS